ncbi:unnamed protein product, partial [Effrenium voratum]
ALSRNGPKMAVEVLARQASPVDGLLAALRSPRSAVRIWALIQIAKLGPIKAEQFQLDKQVSDLLRDEDSAVQEQALLTLGQQGGRGARHVDAIARRISMSMERRVRVAALHALGNLGPSAGSVQSDVLAALDDKDPAVAAAACVALGRMKVTSLDGKLAGMESREPQVVAAACAGLSAMDRRVDAVGKQLSHRDPSVKATCSQLVVLPSSNGRQAAAAKALSGMTKAEDFSPELVRLLSEDAVLRHSAAQTLRDLAPTLAPAQKAELGSLLKGPPLVAGAAAFVLAEVGAAPDQIAALENLLSHKVEDTSACAVTASGAAPPLPAALRKPAVAACAALGAAEGGDKVAPRLTALLESPDAEVRAAAAEALGKLRQQTAVPMLLQGLEDASPAVVLASCRALGSFPSTETGAAVARLLEDPQPTVRASAAHALADMGAEAHVEKIAVLLDDRAPPVQVAAMRALATCERGQLHAAAVCRLALKADERTCVTALQTLMQLGERGAAYAEELHALLDAATPEIATQAHRALDCFRGGRDAVPSLADLPKVQLTIAAGTPGLEG